MAKKKKFTRRALLIALLISSVLLTALYYAWSPFTESSLLKKSNPFSSLDRNSDTPEILKPVRESVENTNSGNRKSPLPSHEISEDAVPPGMEQLKEELENGPPAKGPSIVKYAEKLTDKMGEAEENPAKVPEVFKELERCMRGDAQDEVEAAMQLPAVKAMCLFNAGELAQQFPEYKERHRKLKDSASQQVKDILKYTEGE